MICPECSNDMTLGELRFFAGKWNARLIFSKKGSPTPGSWRRKIWPEYIELTDDQYDLSFHKPRWHFLINEILLATKPFIRKNAYRCSNCRYIMISED